MKRFIFVFLVAISIYAVNWFDNPQRYPNSNYRIPLYKYNPVAFRDSIFMLTEANLFLYLQNSGFTDTLSLADSLTAVQLRSKNIMIDSLGVLRDDLYIVLSDSHAVALDSSRVVLTDAKLYTDARETAVRTSIADSTGALVDSLKIVLSDSKIYTRNAIKDSLKQTDLILGDSATVNLKLKIGGIGIENEAGYLSIKDAILYVYDNAEIVGQLGVSGKNISYASGYVGDSLKFFVGAPSHVASRGFISMETIDSRPYLTLSNTGLRFNSLGGRTWVADTLYVDGVAIINECLWADTLRTYVVTADSGKVTDWNVDGKLGIGTSNRYFELRHPDTLAVSVPVLESLGKLSSQLGYFDLGSGLSITPTETTAGRTRTTIAGSDSIHFTKPIYFYGTDFNPNRYYMTSPTSLIAGEGAGAVNMSGANNTIYGNSSGKALTSGIRNTFIGDNVHILTTTGGANTSVGYRAGRSNSGFNNVFLGSSSGTALGAGSANTFLGFESGLINTTGGSNVYIGNEAGKTATATQSNRLIIANSETANLITGEFDTGIVTIDKSLQTDSIFAKANNKVYLRSDFIPNRYFGTSPTSTVIGEGAGKLAMASPQNILIGYESGFSMSTGVGRNTFVGVESGRANSTGSQNVFLGYYAGRANTTALGNTMLGTESGKSNTTGANNTFSGYFSGWVNTTGGNNTFTGAVSGFANTTGQFNTFTGSRAGRGNISGLNNIAYGDSAAWNMTTGNRNIVIGSRVSLVNATDSDKFVIGQGTWSGATLNQTRIITGDLTTGKVIVTGDFDHQLRHAHMYYTDQTTAINLTQNVWSHLSNATKDLYTIDESAYITCAGDSIVIQTDGDYVVFFNADGEAATNGDIIRIGIAKNSDTPLNIGKPRDKAGANDQVLAHNWNWYLKDLVAGDRLKFMVTNTVDNDNYTPNNGAVYIRKEHDKR